MVDPAGLGLDGRAGREPPIPLSFAQQRLWFLDQLLPRPDVYNVPAIYEIRSDLDVARLRAAFGELTCRHESLRTSFGSAGGQATQVVAPTIMVPLTTHDVRTVPAHLRGRKVRRLAARQARHAFDLTRAPLWRAGLIRVDAEEYRLLLTLHHIIADGWSLPILIGDLVRLYAAPTEELAPLPLRYADFAVWQRDRLTGPRLHQQLAHWREHLAGDEPSLRLPTDRPRPRTASHRGGAVEFVLPGEEYDAVGRLSRQLRATPFMVLLAGFVALLHRYTGQDAVTLGIPVANRTHREFEELVGFFTNTLALRTDTSGEPTFAELVRRVRSTTLAALDQQELPFERLVEELDPERDMSHQPLVQVLFAMTLMTTTWEAPGLRVRWLRPVRTATAKFDLSLLLYEEDGRLRGAAEYARDLFDRRTIRRLVGHLRTLLRAATAHPHTRISLLELFTPVERATVLSAAAGPPVPAGRAATLVELFDEQAAGTPGAVALTTPEKSMTYQELRHAADRLAGRLRSVGAGPETLVGICLPPSAAMAVSVLAVLRAGGAYVPLDPTLPARRLAFMVSDSGMTMLITDSGLSRKLPALPRHVVLADHDDDTDHSVTPPSDLCQDNLAYVIYTSGSTGRPKGVAMTHRALVNLVEWHNETLPAGRRTLMFASLGFDVSCYEMFTAWLSGGSVVILAEDERLDVEHLADVLVRHGVEKAILPVTVLQRLAEADGGGRLAAGRLTEIVSTGEQLVVTQPIVRLFTRLPAARLHNHYGPTETHVATAHPLAADPDAWPSHPPIGAPIRGARVHLLDRNLRPVPFGVPGELYLGGVALARGYAHRPGLTADRFVPDPVSGRPGQRLYRTGDLARLSGDGVIEYLGRVDDQVKVRGHRVEPGEIAAALCRHPDVREAVVVARQDAPGDLRLVAYFAGDAEPGAVRRFLRARLPDYMVPSAFVPIDALPLTPNGKVDRTRLPAPPLSTVAHVPPRDRAEAVIAAIWSEVLGVADVGVHDDFFELGGHSLLAAQIVVRLRDSLRRDVPLAALFDHPTVADLATTFGNP